MTTQGSRREAGASKGPRDGGTSVEGGGVSCAPATPERLAAVVQMPERDGAA